MRALRRQYQREDQADDAEDAPEADAIRRVSAFSMPDEASQSCTHNGVGEPNDPRVSLEGVPHESQCMASNTSRV
jgi:hypothetical protein